MEERILVVDDDPITRIVLRHILEQVGYTVTEAGDGLESLQKLHEAEPHLMLLDLVMPHFDGFQVCRYLRNTAVSSPPIIILSGKTERDTIDQGQRLGARQYLTKSILPSEIMHQIRNVLAAH